MNFSAKAVPMTRQGLANALTMLSMNPGETAALWAVFEVETAGVTQGFGFRPDKRPHILFERHKFRDFTGGKFNSSNPELSGSAGGYGTLAEQYTKLERALSLCQEANLGEEPALNAASWGIGQVMGFNHQAAGYLTAKAMVEAMVQSEDAQLSAMVAFMVERRLDRALRNQDWERFARLYNGASYAQNRYDIKLQVQYARFAGGSAPDIEVRTAQAALLLLGYSPGKIDGTVGRRTRDAIRGFQIASGLSATGELSGDTYSMLWSAAYA
jgi:hypothetical protein